MKKRVKRAGRACAVALTGVVLAGCAATGDAVPTTDEPAAKELSAETFTTVGKPTKTIETPWGPREIYDPVQDPEVRAAFKEIYSDSATESYFENKNKVPVRLYSIDYDRRDNLMNSEAGKIIDYASKARSFELLRMGCRQYEDRQCFQGRTYFDGSCTNSPEQSSHILSQCERASQQNGDIVFSCTFDGDAVKAFHMEAIGDPHQGSILIQKTNFFEQKCTQWNR